MPLDINKELEESYARYCKPVFGEENVIIGIIYLDTIRGGIAGHRDKYHLTNAIQHIQAMRERDRIKRNGTPEDFTIESIKEILVRCENDISAQDVDEAVDRCCSEGYFPDPNECALRIESMKVELRDMVRAKNRENARSSTLFAERLDAVMEQLANLQLKLRRQISIIQQQAGALQHGDEIIREQAETIQQKDYTIQEQADTIQEQADTIQEQADTIQVKNYIILQQAEANKEKNLTIMQQADTIQQQADTNQQQADTIEKLKRLLEESGIKLSHL